MINVDTKISIGELTDWQLLWMCVELEHDVIGKRLSVDEIADACTRIEDRCSNMLQQWDTIYNHPSGLRDELQKLPRWIELSNLLLQARQEAYDKHLKAHSNGLRTKLSLQHAE